MNIKATNTTLTPAIREAIETKLEKLAKFFKPEDKIRVEIEISKKHKSGLVARAEVDVQPHGHYAEATGEDFYAALDIVIPKIKEQILKTKAKIISRRKKT